MNTLRRYLTAEIAAATGLMMAALLMLLAFFDLVNDMNDLGRGAYHLPQIIIHVLLSLPNHVYEVFPIAALIGTLFAMAQLVASSEYTVMRTSGVSVLRMNVALVAVGVGFGVLTFIFGEFIGPPAEQLAVRLRSQAITGIVAQEFRSGLWIKDNKSFVNVIEVGTDAALRGVRIYDFDNDYRLQSISLAARGHYASDRQWILENVVQTSFDGSKTTVRNIPQVSWHSVLDPALLNVLLVKPDQMSAWSLYSFSEHLKENHQKALRYEIALWTKLVYPLAVPVMMMLALPFAQTQRRQGGVGTKIFTGIMLGLAFHFMNRLFGHLGLLYDWPPLLSAVSPTLMFLGVALGMTWWQEKR
ncbi:MAG TPA: LPS export ABC transporter permease LptG [Burkholderiales bacterium]|nr:LPS export ABC transporter permease LptG [Burkholderiales bacterium]